MSVRYTQLNTVIFQFQTKLYQHLAPSPIDLPTMTTHRVLDNAELLGLILGHLNTYACTKLISTSQTFFRQAATYIWKDLKYPRPLLLLIPGVQQTESRRGKKILKVHLLIVSGSCLRLIIPHQTQLPPSPADFSRFDLYAPFVRNLWVFGPQRYGRHSNFGIDASWQTLILRARQSPLLPNLKELTIDESFETDDEPVLWVSAFASPSLESFRAENMEQTHATSSMTSVILGLLAEHCRDLRQLKLYVGPPDKDNDTPLYHGHHPTKPSLLRVLLGAPVSQTWQTLQNLRSLVTDVSAINMPSLSSLGHLPHLNSIEIHGVEPRTYSHQPRFSSDIRNMAFAENSFPNLRRLAVRNLHHEDLVLLWDLEDLVGDLEEVGVGIDLVNGYISEEKVRSAEKFTSEFFPVLSARSPSLKALIIDLNPSKHDAEPITAMTLDIEQFKPLITLPLQRVELAYITLQTSEIGDKFFNCRIAMLWPNAVHLKLLHQPVGSDKLHHFASLPSLRYLALRVSWAPVHESKTVILDFKNLPLHTLEFTHRPRHEVEATSTEEYAK
jgi:hypothetical protein